MTNDQEKRLEEIKLRHITDTRSGAIRVVDFKWLLTLIDEQRGESEELKQMLQRWETDPLTELTAVNAKVEKLRGAFIRGYHEFESDESGMCFCGQDADQHQEGGG